MTTDRHDALHNHAPRTLLEEEMAFGIKRRERFARRIEFTSLTPHTARPRIFPERIDHRAADAPLGKGLELDASGFIEAVSGIESAEVRELMGDEAHAKFCEDVAIAGEALPAFDKEKFLKGEMTPVLFGSAVTNFGVEHLLSHLKDLAPPPRPIPLDDGGSINPEEKRFTGFIFKMQANMNKLHRDRVAFLRITSGKFERGMSVSVPRLEKEVKLANPVAFFGQERTTIDTAYAGDIIGIISPGLYRLGDILCEGAPPAFHPLPRFAPDVYARIVLTDTAKAKQFRKGISELADEGVVQLFNLSDATPLIGVIGQLQFEVFAHRLESEFNAPIELTGSPYQAIRATDAASADRLRSIGGIRILRRGDGAADHGVSEALGADHDVGVGEVRGVGASGGQNTADVAGKGPVRVAHVDPGLAAETGVDDLVPTRAAVQLGEDHGGGHDFALQPAGRLECGSDLSKARAALAGTPALRSACCTPGGRGAMSAAAPRDEAAARQRNDSDRSR